MSKELKFSFVSKNRTSIKIDLVKNVNHFLDAKKLSNRSPKTIHTYAQTLDQFAKWVISEHGKDAAINKELIKSYIRFLTSEKRKWDDHITSPTGEVGLSPRSVNNIIRILKIFFKYLTTERIISMNPMDGIEYLLESKDSFNLFTDEEVTKLLNSPNQRVYTGRRDYCMMLVLIDCGLRIGELTNLNVRDVDFKLRQITLPAAITKGSKARIVPISPKTAKELEKLVNYMDIDEDDYLWLSQFGERYYAGSFAKMLKLYAKRAGIAGPRVSPHTFRHYFAVTYLRQGGDVLSLMRILGHSSLETTQVYVKYTENDLRGQHDVASPVTNLLDTGNERKRGKRHFK